MNPTLLTLKVIIGWEKQQVNNELRCNAVCEEPSGLENTKTKRAISTWRIRESEKDTCIPSVIIY